MNKEEAGKLILIITDFVHNFKPSVRVAESWQRVLGGMSYAEAEKHMYAHFQELKYAPMPAEIIARARAAFNPDLIVPIDPPDDLRGGLLDANRLRNRD